MTWPWMPLQVLARPAAAGGALPVWGGCFTAVVPPVAAERAGAKAGAGADAAGGAEAAGAWCCLLFPACLPPPPSRPPPPPPAAPARIHNSGIPPPPPGPRAGGVQLGAYIRHGLLQPWHKGYAAAYPEWFMAACELLEAAAR
jgi:hypothetical protein